MPLIHDVLLPSLTYMEPVGATHQGCWCDYWRPVLWKSYVLNGARCGEAELGLESWVAVKCDLASICQVCSRLFDATAFVKVPNIVS